MINILCHLFIKDKDNILDPKVRNAYGTITGTVGILNNIFLFIIKFIAGIITGAISITADAFNNLSDAGSSIITLIGFRMASKPADYEHPYGHGRIEYVSGLIIAFIILLMGFELLKSSVEKIIEPEPIEFSLISIAILIISIFIKLWMTLYNKKLGKKLNSSAMIATSADSFNDSVATTVVLLCLLFSKFTNINIDGYAGCIVALFVIWSGYQTIKETIKPLLGTTPDNNTVKQIEDIVLQQDGIQGIHDMIIHDYGPGRLIVSLHAEVSDTIDIVTAHNIIDAAENNIKNIIGCEITIHIDPIATNDRKTRYLKNLTLKLIKEIDTNLDIHDFRIRDEESTTYIIFDLSVPFDLNLSNDYLKETIKEKFRCVGYEYFVIVEDIDRVVRQ